jgi:hypothetical protein
MVTFFSTGTFVMTSVKACVVGPAELFAVIVSG